VTCSLTQPIIVSETSAQPTVPLSRGTCGGFRYSYELIYLFI